MNTLTVTVLLVCVAAAYASALPGNPAVDDAAAVAVAPAEELLQGQENKWRGGGYYRGGGGYYRGGGGYYRGGGGYNGYYRRWGK